MKKTMLMAMVLLACLGALAQNKTGKNVPEVDVTQAKRFAPLKVSEKATVDVYGVCYIPSYTFVSTIGVLCCYTYRRGLSRRCSFRLLWAMRRPRSIGRVTGTDSPPFSFYMSNYFFLF